MGMLLCKVPVQIHIQRICLENECWLGTVNLRCDGEMLIHSRDARAGSTEGRHIVLVTLAQLNT